MSTTTSPTSAARSSTASSTPGRASTQRSGRGRPVSTSKPSPTTLAAAGEGGGVEGAGVDQPRGREQPGDLVEDAQVLGHGAAVGVGVDEDGRLAAMGVAGGEADRERRTPGAPAGPCTATIRPGARVDSGLAGRPARDRAPGHGCRRTRRLRAACDLVERHERQHADPVERLSGAAHGDAADVVTEQAHHRVGIEAVEVAGHHGDVGLPGAALASRSCRSTHRLITTIGRLSSRRNAAASQVSPPAASRTATRLAIGSALPGHDDPAVGDAAERRTDVLGAVGGDPDDHLAGGLRGEAVRRTRDRDHDDVGRAPGQPWPRRR